MNLAELAEDSLQRLGERKSLVFENVVRTNAELQDQARRLHTGFADLGVGRGQVVALCLANDPLVFPTFQAIFRCGATCVPVMFQLSADELRFVLEDTAAGGVVTDAQILPKVREALMGNSAVEWILVRGGSDIELRANETALEDWLSAPPKQDLPQIDDDDVAVMLYTSGTTGKPKGVMLTHRNLIAAATTGNKASELDRWQGPRISVSAMPMAHIFGVGMMNGGFLAPPEIRGYGVHLRWFEPESFMGLIQQHQATVIPAVPTMLALILNHPKVNDFDLSSLREVVCGAAPLPVELSRTFEQRYGCRVREIYGMTENSGIATANRPSDAYRPGSAGRAYDGTELRIVDADDRPVATLGRGEIVTRGPSTMKGYHNRPEATAEALRGGWLHTGDVGYLDEDGFLYIVDRMKDMILRGGENIYPAELEQILYQHPDIAEAAVVGVPDEIYGEAVVCYVVEKVGRVLDPQEVIDFVRQRTSKFKAPQSAFVIDALPKSGVGKILRRELRDRALQDFKKAPA